MGREVVTKIFVGYSEETKGYRLMDPITYKVSIARDVIFFENKFFKETSHERINEPTVNFPEEIIEEENNNSNDGNTLTDATNTDKIHAEKLNNPQRTNLKMHLKKTYK